MRALLRRPKVWIALLTFAILGLLLFPSFKNVLDVTAVQNAVQRDWEIDFFDRPRLQGGMPTKLLGSLDGKVGDVLEYFYGDTRGYDDSGPPKTRNRDMVYRERFRALFRGPIEGIGVYYFKAYHGDLGAAFARFPHLRRVTVTSNEQDLPTEAEWTKLCTRLRAWPNLESIEIQGVWITDAALAPLAGHPNLRSITITYGRFTKTGAKTLATLPHLKTLLFGEQITDEEATLTPEKKAAIIAALPGVSITFPDLPTTEEAPPTDPQ